MRTYFNHETFDVYQLEFQFITWMTLVAKGICTTQEIDNGKQLLLRIKSILTKLIQRFDLPVPSLSSSSIVREEGDEQVFEDEKEDEKNE